jgi:hypothetical protein
VFQAGENQCLIDVHLNYTHIHTHSRIEGFLFNLNLPLCYQ